MSAEDLAYLPRSETAAPAWFLASGILILRCPNGHAQEFLRQVYPDGSVGGSVTCNRCDWHTFVQLDDWPRMRQ